MCPPVGTWFVVRDGGGMTRSAQLAMNWTMATESWWFVRHGPRISAGKTASSGESKKSGKWLVAYGL